MPPHEVDVRRTRNERPDVPAALHLTCTCGWTSSAADDDAAAQLVRDHVRSGDPAPPPYSPSPD